MGADPRAQVHKTNSGFPVIRYSFMAEERRSAAIAIVGRDAGSIDMSQLSQSLPCKPRSLARTSPAMEPPPLELPKSLPASEPFEDTEKGRTLIRYSAEISAAEFSCSPTERQEFLSQSCPTWSTFRLPRNLTPEEEITDYSADEPAVGMAVPCQTNSTLDKFAENEAMGKSPTILESFKMLNVSAHPVSGAEEMDGFSKHALDEISEEVEVDDDDEAQFSLEA